MDTEKILQAMRANFGKKGRQTHEIITALEKDILYKRDRIRLYGETGWTGEEVLDYLKSLQMSLKEIREDYDQLLLAHADELEERDQQIETLERVLAQRGATQ